MGWGMVMRTTWISVIQFHVEKLKPQAVWINGADYGASVRRILHLYSFNPSHFESLVGMRLAPAYS